MRTLTFSGSSDDIFQYEEKGGGDEAYAGSDDIAASIPRAARLHRCATLPLSRQHLRPVEVFIEPRTHLSASRRCR